MQTLYKEQEKLSLKRVYYTGTDVLREGYALMYDRENITAPDINGDALPATSSSYARHAYVKKPDAQGAEYFAGIVAPGEYKTGPCWITIIERDKRMHTAYTKANCTMGVTQLYVVNGQYYLAAAGLGDAVALAFQTKDTSGTAGLTQVWLDASPLSPIHRSYAYTAGAFGPSPAIWRTCPWDAIMQNPTLGYGFWDNFLRFPPHGSTAAAAVTGALGVYETYLDIGGAIACAAAYGGGITLSSDGDNEMAAIGPYVAPFKINATDAKKFWFEAALKTSTIADTKHGIFCGLIAAGAVATTVPIAADGTLADTNFIGFHRLEADGDYLDTVHRADGQTQVTTKADAILLAAATVKKVGMYFDGTQVLFYADGVVLADEVDATALAAATFPSDVTLGPVFGVMNATGTTPGNSTLLWWRMAQLY